MSVAPLAPHRTAASAMNRMSQQFVLARWPPADPAILGKPSEFPHRTPPAIWESSSESMFLAGATSVSNPHAIPLPCGRVAGVVVVARDVSRKQRPPPPTPPPPQVGLARLAQQYVRNPGRPGFRGEGSTRSAWQLRRQAHRTRTRPWRCSPATLGGAPSRATSALRLSRGLKAASVIVADGTMNLVGALRKAMVTTGYIEIKEFQRVEIVVG